MAGAVLLEAARGEPDDVGVDRDLDDGVAGVAVLPPGSDGEHLGQGLLPGAGRRIIAQVGEHGASTYWQHSAQCLRHDGNASRSLAQDSRRHHLPSPPPPRCRSCILPVSAACATIKIAWVRTTHT